MAVDRWIDYNTKSIWIHICNSCLLTWTQLFSNNKETYSITNLDNYHVKIFHQKVWPVAYVNVFLQSTVEKRGVKQWAHADCCITDCISTTVICKHTTRTRSIGSMYQFLPQIFWEHWFAIVPDVLRSGSVYKATTIPFINTLNIQNNSP